MGEGGETHTQGVFYAGHIHRLCQCCLGVIIKGTNGHDLYIRRELPHQSFLENRLDHNRQLDGEVNGGC